MVWKKRRVGLLEKHPQPADVLPFSVKGRIGRVENPPAAAFAKRFIQKNRPIIITGAMDDWRACRAWDVAYLRERAGSQEGEVIVSTNGLYPDYLSQPEPMTKIQLSFGEFLDRASDTGRFPPLVAAGETYYIYGKPYLFEAVPGLAEDTPIPAPLGAVKVSSTNLWVSSSGCTTPLHYDLTNGLLCQVRGKKQVYLFAPDQADHLYQRGRFFPGMDNFERQSQIDIHHPDFEKYPRFKQVQAWECTLHPGEMLFIPSNWFHEVETLAFSISVGFCFAGGTATSEFAGMADAFKSAVGEKAAPDGNGFPATEAMEALERQLAQNPELLTSLLQSPQMERLLKDPNLLRDLEKLMGGGKG